MIYEGTEESSGANAHLSITLRVLLPGLVMKINFKGRSGRLHIQIKV